MKSWMACALRPAPVRRCQRVHSCATLILSKKNDIIYDIILQEGPLGIQHQGQRLREKATLHLLQGEPSAPGGVESGPGAATPERPTPRLPALSVSEMRKRQTSSRRWPTTIWHHSQSRLNIDIRISCMIYDNSMNYMISCMISFYVYDIMHETYFRSYLILYI
jgi:hypothetical protein